MPCGYLSHLLLILFSLCKKSLSQLITKRIRDAALLEENKSLVIIARNISLGAVGSWLPFSFTSHFFLFVQKNVLSEWFTKRFRGASLKE